MHSLLNFLILLFSLLDKVIKVGFNFGKCHKHSLPMLFHVIQNAYKFLQAQHISVILIYILEKYQNEIFLNDDF